MSHMRPCGHRGGQGGRGRRTCAVRRAAASEAIGAASDWSIFSFFPTPLLTSVHSAVPVFMPKAHATPYGMRLARRAAGQSYRLRTFFCNTLFCASSEESVVGLLAAGSSGPAGDPGRDGGRSQVGWNGVRAMAGEEAQELHCFGAEHAAGLDADND